jgi:hypothetical protein
MLRGRLVVRTPGGGRGGRTPAAAQPTGLGWARRRCQRRSCHVRRTVFPSRLAPRAVLTLRGGGTLRVRGEIMGLIIIRTDRDLPTCSYFPGPSHDLPPLPPVSRTTVLWISPACLAAAAGGSGGRVPATWCFSPPGAGMASRSRAVRWWLAAARISWHGRCVGHFLGDCDWPLLFRCDWDLHT